MAVDAHHARVMTMNSNRLLAKQEHLFALMVPRQEGDTITGGGEAPFLNTWSDGIRSWVPTTAWMRLTAPFPIAKKPGLHRAELRVMARVSGSHTVYLQVATKARPFNSSAAPSSSNVITLTGDGDDDVDSYTKTGLWIDPAPYEEISIYVKALPTGDQADTTIGGDPNARSDEPSITFAYEPTFLKGPSSGGNVDWTIPGWSRTGAELVFFDVDGGTIARRIITSVTQEGPISGGTRQLHFAPALTDAQLHQVQLGDDWAVFALPTIGLVGLTLAAEARTV